MKTLENFESIASTLYAECPSEKARFFADKVFNAIRARGNEWIIANSDKLHLKFSAPEMEATAPVEDNRLWWMAEWQKALNRP